MHPILASGFLLLGLTLSTRHLRHPELIVPACIAFVVGCFTANFLGCTHPVPQTPVFVEQALHAQEQISEDTMALRSVLQALTVPNTQGDAGTP